jgi:predicted transcriptional regulator of viral defense system
VARGLYRFPDVRRDESDAYAEAVLRVGPDAHLDSESVLALHGLAFIEPTRVTVATPHRVRLVDPGFVEVVQRRLPAEDVTEYDGIPATRVWRVLIEARETVMTERLEGALAEARRRDLLTPLEARRVRRALRE